MSRTISIPMSREAPPCELCRLPATGIYKWERKVFSTIVQDAAMLCATCSQKVLNKVSMYVIKETDEQVFYRPNSNMVMEAVFDYERPVTIVHEPLVSEHRAKRRLAGGMARTLLRVITHDQRVDPVAYKGSPGRRWLHSVECSACHVKYARATKATKCPGCGAKN